MKVQSKQAEYVAAAGLALSIVFSAATFLLSRWSGSAAIYAVSWQVLAGVLIWLVLVILFHQRALAEQEKLDTAQLAKTKPGQTIFHTQDERAAMFAVAQRRLQVLEKWFIPIFSALIAAYEIGIGLYLLQRTSIGPEVEINQPLAGAVYMAAIAFVSFLTSRYATGMSREQQWRPLRAGGSFLCAIAILCFAIAIALALAQFKFGIFLAVLAWVIPVLLIILGTETALNILLDLYRPRVKGRHLRWAFDSRLLALINEPGGILRTAAGAIDYQFGFKVSQTWFYKLIEKAVVPLVLFSVATLYLLSCFIIINPGEEAVIEHFGTPVTSGGSKTFGPGLVLKWPWPIDIAYKHPTRQIKQINIGFIPEENPALATRPLLWDRPHYKEEYNLLVATETDTEYSRTQAVPISLVKAAVPVQYRVNDLYAYMYNHRNAEKTLEAICYRELVRFAASAKIETDQRMQITAGRQGGKSKKQSLLGAGRAQAAEFLTRQIQAAADRENLGVEIVFLGLQGVHPPQEVAQDYQQVVGAVQRKQADVLNALAESKKTLGLLAGSVEKAEQLYALTARYQRLKDQADPADVQRAAEALDAAFGTARGDIFAALRTAKSYAFDKATLARATGRRFGNQLKAFRAAPEIYKHEQRLAMLEESLEKIRKYVVVADPNDAQIFIFDFEEKLIPSLYDITGVEKPG